MVRLAGILNRSFLMSDSFVVIFAVCDAILSFCDCILVFLCFYFPINAEEVLIAVRYKKNAVCCRCPRLDNLTKFCVKYVCKSTSTVQVFFFFAVNGLTYVL